MKNKFFTRIAHVGILTVTACLSFAQSMPVAASTPGPILYLPRSNGFRMEKYDGNSYELLNPSIYLDSGIYSAMAISPDQTRAYVATYTDPQRLDVIDLQAQTVIASVSLPDRGYVPPFGIGCGAADVLVHPSGSPVYVACTGSNTVEQIDTANATIIEPHIGVSGPQSLQMFGNYLYVHTERTGLVVFNADDITQSSVVIGAQPSFGIDRAVADPLTQWTYASASPFPYLRIGNMQTGGISNTIELSGNPRFVYLSPDNSKLFVGVQSSVGEIAVFNAAGKDSTLAYTIPLPGAPMEMAWNADNSCLFVQTASYSGPPNVQVIDTHTNAIVGQIDTGYGGLGTRGNFVRGVGAQAVQINHLNSSSLVKEAAENSGMATVVVSRGCDTRGSLSVDYYTQPADTGSPAAQPGVNYQHTAGTLVFADGEISKTINIPLMDNNTYAGSVLDFQVFIANANIVSSKNQVIVRIVDDEQPPVEADVFVNLSSSKDGMTVQNGDQIEYLMSIGNHAFGNSATNILVTETLPAGTRFATIEVVDYNGGGGGGSTVLNRAAPSGNKAALDHKVPPALQFGDKISLGYRAHLSQLLAQAHLNQFKHLSHSTNGPTKKPNTARVNTPNATNSTLCNTPPVGQAGMITCAIDTLYPSYEGASIFIRVTVNVVNPPAQTLVNTAQISSQAPTDPNLGNNTASNTLTVASAPSAQVNLKIIATSRNQASPGASLPYTITVTNTGNQTATGVMINEVVPASTKFLSPDPQWSCTVNDPADTTCSQLIGQLKPGQSKRVRFNVRVLNPVAAGVSQITNNLSVSDDGTHGADANPSDNQTSLNVPLTNAQPNLKLTSDDKPNQVRRGNVLTYEMSYDNKGNQDATGVTISTTVPVSTAFEAAASTAGWSCVNRASAGSVCQFTLGHVSVNNAQPDAKGKVAFAVRVGTNFLPAAGISITNVAEIFDDGENGADSAPADNIASRATPLLNARPDLRLTSDDRPNRVRAGELLTYVLSFNNIGNEIASGVSISTQVPVSTSFEAAVSSTGWVCANGGTSGAICRFELGAVPYQDTLPNAKGIVNFVVRVVPGPAAGGNIQHTAVIQDDGLNGADVNLANNSTTRVTPMR